MQRVLAIADISQLQVKEGIDAVIVDSVLAIRKGLQAASTDGSSDVSGPIHVPKNGTGSSTPSTQINGLKAGEIEKLQATVNKVAVS